MGRGEFELIERYFAHRAVRRSDVRLGIGDDCALLAVPPGMELAITVDTLVDGVHFPSGTAAAAVGHKALAVSLSDLAAMGAEPAWATLSLALPEADEPWLEGFCDGLFALAEEHGVALVGGDTVRGPLAVTLQLHGLVPAGTALRRSGARPGDLVYVTGTLGDAGAGLALALGQRNQTGADAEWLSGRLDRPTPRVAAGLALRGYASAAIDLSDGLVADLGHILEASGVGARLEVARLPLSGPLQRSVEPGEAQRLALGAGDDYELCFTVAPERAVEVAAALAERGGATRIGAIEAGTGLRLVDAAGEPVALDAEGYDHFRSSDP